METNPICRSREEDKCVIRWREYDIADVEECCACQKRDVIEAGKVITTRDDIQQGMEATTRNKSEGRKLDRERDRVGNILGALVLPTVGREGEIDGEARRWRGRLMHIVPAYLLPNAPNMQT